MLNVCLNCGNDIHVMIFKGGQWCSDYCRKVIMGKIKCGYEWIWDPRDGDIEICYIHGESSKYNARYGPTRPCLAVEGWDD